MEGGGTGFVWGTILEEWIGKGMEGGGTGFVWGTILEVTCKEWGNTLKTSVRIVISSEIQTVHFLITSCKWHC